MLKALYLDTETTGLDPKEHDIVHLAMISEVDGKVKEEAEFFMQPLRMDNVSTESLRANGLTMDQLARFPLQLETFPKIIEFLCRQVDPYDSNDKMYPVGYNVRFDLGFLYELFQKNNRDVQLGNFVKWQDVDLLYLMYRM